MRRGKGVGGVKKLVIFCGCYKWMTPIGKFSKLILFLKKFQSQKFFFAKLHHSHSLTEAAARKYITAIHLQKHSEEAYCAPPPFPLFARGSGWASHQFFKKRGGDLTGSQFLERGCWERWKWWFSGGCSFYIKNKLKSQIFNEKKNSSPKMLFSVTTKNLNWKILTKNWITFKRWDEIKAEKL